MPTPPDQNPSRALMDRVELALATEPEAFLSASRLDGIVNAVRCDIGLSGMKALNVKGEQSSRDEMHSWDARGWRTRSFFGPQALRQRMSLSTRLRSVALAAASVLLLGAVGI